MNFIRIVFWSGVGLLAFLVVVGLLLVVGITLQGKMTAGKTLGQAVGELLLEVVGRR